jgi:O-antigen ligase
VNFLQIFEKDTWRQKALWFTCCIMVLTFCWHKQVNSIFMVPLFLLFLVDKTIVSKFKEAFSHKYVWLNLLFVSIVAAGLLYTQDVHGGTDTLVRKLTLLIFPLVFCGHLFFNTRNIALLMNAFCISCLGALIYCEIIGVYRYFTRNYNSEFLIYELLAYPIMHPGYFSNFFCVAVWWLVQPWLRGRLPGDFKPSIQIILLCIFIAFIGVLTSKTAFLVLVAYAGVVVVVLAKGKMSVRAKAIGIGGALAAVFTVLIIVRILIWDRFVQGGLGALTNPDTNPTYGNSVGSRSIALREGFKIVQESPIFGHGTGMANPKLLQQLIKQNYTDLVKHDMHTHSQIIHTLLDVGIIGIVSLIVLGLYTLRYFTKHKNYFGIGMLALASVNFFTDDMLEIQAGVVPFAFFITMAFAHQLWLNSASLKTQLISEGKAFASFDAKKVQGKQD